jgi:hypothetical protein
LSVGKNVWLSRVTVETYPPGLIRPA